MSPPSNASFYKDLAILDNFFETSNTSNHHPLPADWYVAVSNISNSTEAIEQGKYKAVNILGASPIVAMLNTTERSAIPYTFGGDGSAFCLPPKWLSEARQVLATSRQIGEKEYGLNLRTSIIPISHIQEEGYTIRVARYRVSDTYVRAVFSGGGLKYAEQILKKTEHNDFNIPPSSADFSSIDFTGLECRWQKIRPTQQKRIITLLVQVNEQCSNPHQIYDDVFKKLRNVFGFDDQSSPVTASTLNMTMSVSELMGETRIHTFGKNWLQRILYLLKAEIQVGIGKLLMRLNYNNSATDWSL